MAAADDPAMLFTPEKPTVSPTNDELVAGANRPLNTPQKPSDTRQQPVPSTSGHHISPPSLMTSERGQHKDANAVDEDNPKTVIAVVGEHEHDGKLYMFVKQRNGICVKMKDFEVRAEYKDLYEEYQHKKKTGVLEPFDPTAASVQFQDRVGMKSPDNTSRQRRSTRKAAAITPHYKDDVVSASEESDGDKESDGYDNGSDRRPQRRSSRVVVQQKKAKGNRDLPFSPKKTRSMASSKAVARSNSDYTDSEDDLNLMVKRPKRAAARSARTRMIVDDDEDDNESAEEEQTAKTSRRKGKSTRRTGSRAAYGLIRSLDDLYDSDPETATLRAHRDICEKCHEPPAHVVLARLRRRKGRRRAPKSDEDEEDEEEKAENHGGWVRCLKCCVAAHWGCLAGTQKTEILKAAQEKDKEDSPDQIIARRKHLETNQTTDFVCGACSKGGICYVCHEVAVKPYVPKVTKKPPEEGDETMDGIIENGGSVNNQATAIIGANDAATASGGVDEEKHSENGNIEEDIDTKQLLFRCRTCKRLAHYDHLPVDEEVEVAEIARFYQEDNDWECSDCVSYVFPVEKVIAWRPAIAAPTFASLVAPVHGEVSEPSYKDNLPREYLIKWEGRSYRRLQWVPHMWLLSVAPTRLKNFMAHGSQIELLPSAEAASASTPLTTRTVKKMDPRAAAPDGEARIPPAWKTIDRILDVLFWHPHSDHKKKKGKESSIELTRENLAEIREIIRQGDEPGPDVTESVEEYVDRTKDPICEKDIDRVVWIFVKWNDLGYEESTWDTPPLRGESGYQAFVDAFEYFALSQALEVQKVDKKTALLLDTRGGEPWSYQRLGIPKNGKYDINQDPKLKLMDFQIYGVNWLCKNWWVHQHCILADEMGLGKTVQIVTFLGLIIQAATAWPALIVVPNSTITNWVREFDRWAPALRVVPFYGEAKSRDVVKKYELYHSNPRPGTTGAKYHVLITTYDTITNSKDFSVFRNNPRWEALVVDEGQRLKNDSSLLFRKLGELNSKHRIIMTGTPLNNNIRELFNLMNFLDPIVWKDLEAMEREYEELTEESLKELHKKLRPYFLRRQKSEVLKLPPKNEVIVPVSMTPLQKEVYKSILSQNLHILQSLASTDTTQLRRSVVKKTNMNNMLMQLRKCLQHPYLIEDIEPKGLPPDEEHIHLIDASAKLRLLKSLLPKLKERNHRVLLFSQFVIVLDIVEDFLVGEGYKFLRLDGNTKQAIRQADMDAFNSEGSDVFIYMLTTRAGGVGINLWSADTVIIFDPDFNPHQDLQAIARSHRYGQTKPCLVFKLMVKDSAEEKIMQTGKKKLVLDHVIVQKLNDDEDGGSDLQSILTYGAQALFEDSGAKDIAYSDADLEKLIEKTETGDGEQTEESAKNPLAFAKIWSFHAEDLMELDNEETPEQADSWAQTLAKIAEEQNLAKKSEKSGRGVRRKAALAAQRVFDMDESGKPGPDSPPKAISRRKVKPGTHSDSEDEYKGSRAGTPEVDSDSSEAAVEAVDSELMLMEISASTSAPTRNAPPPHRQSSVMERHELRRCGLCRNTHGLGQCWMTQNPSNLIEYRKMLIENSNDEPVDRRREAIALIEENLMKRGYSMDAINGRKEQPPKKARAVALNTTAPPQSKAITPEINGSARPSISNMPTPLASLTVKGITSKQPMSTQPRTDNDNGKRNMSRGAFEDLPRKKKKLGHCVICGKSPHHLVKECSTVKEGRDSILSALAHLLAEGGNEETISILRSILRRPTHRPPPDSAEITEIS